MLLLYLNDVAYEISACLNFGSWADELSKVNFICTLRIVSISEVVN